MHSALYNTKYISRSRLRYEKSL